MNQHLPCRSCGHQPLDLVLDLGQSPLANALLSEEQLSQPEPTNPLELAFCSACALAQITEAPPPEQMFREYNYFSSFSDSFLRHAQKLAERLTEERRLNRNSQVIEAASNDGYLLQYYRRSGVPVLGVEPATNIAKQARERGIPTLNEFFTADLANATRANEGQAADVFHAHNVLAHVPDLNGFVEGIRILLKDDGLAVIEAPYVRDLIVQCEFDTIYHEHLCYFSLTALDYLFARHGLVLSAVERLPVHGGSLRLFASLAAAGRQRGATVVAMLEEEKSLGADRVEFYQEFAQRVARLQQSLWATCSRNTSAAESAWPCTARRRREPRSFAPPGWTRGRSILLWTAAPSSKAAIRRARICQSTRRRNCWKRCPTPCCC